MDGTQTRIIWWTVVMLRQCYHKELTNTQEDDLKNREDLLFNDNPSIKELVMTLGMGRRTMTGERHNTGQSMSGTHCATWQDRYVWKAWYYRTKYVWETWDGQDNIYLERTILQDEACLGMILQDEACPGTVLQDDIYPEALYHITTTCAMVLHLQRAMNPRRTLSQSRNSHYESHMSNDWTSLLHY